MRTLVILACLVLTPVVAYAQAALAGSVRAPDGAALSGVVVEASSPALIEKRRTTTSDGAGRYRIEDLRPGRYAVRFTAPGWQPYEQHGVELSGSFTATVDARLGTGRLSDAITVVAGIPIIDVHTSKREVTLGQDVIRSIPTVRSYNALLVLVPGVATSVNDIVSGTATTSFPIHGGRTNEGRLLIDGLNVGSPPSGNSATSYVVDTGQAQEVTITTSGGLGEAETAGLVMNIVSASGGNVWRASLFGSGGGAHLQSDNLTPELKAQGLTAATPVTEVYDIWGSAGGPMRRDRAWYFVNAHTGGSRRNVAGVYYNQNAGDPAAWLYAPDFARPEYSDRTFENASARITWQVTGRHRITGFWDAQSICRTCSGATAGASEPARVSPEAVGVMRRPLHVAQATWTSSATDRWLFEAGFGGARFGVGNFEREPNPTRGLIRVAEQCAAGCSANGGIAGLVYRSQDFSRSYAGSYLLKASASYVTGTRSLKFGYQHTRMTDDRTWQTNDQNLTYRFDNGVPNQLTQSISPWVNSARAGWHAAFAQAQWTRDRLTLQGAVRFDRAASWFPEQTEGPSRFLPSAIVIPKTRGVDSYKDITPRLGAVYDLSGSGRSAIKVTVGRYLEGVGVIGTYANTNPTLRLPQTTSLFGPAGVTRSWIDQNGNRAPDCDLTNPSAQDLRASGGDACGVMSNTSFGRYVLTNTFDPALLDGWGVRPSDWNVGVSLQQQIGSRAALDVSYVRRTFHGFSAADNRALAASDFTPFSIVAPLDPRLPGGGGYTVAGLRDVVPEKAGQIDNFIADAGQYGRWSQRFDGIDVTFTVRSARNFTFAGGTSTGQTVADTCGVRARLPELSTATTGTSAFGAGLLSSAVTPVSPYCHVAFGVLTQLRGLATYVVPVLDVQLATTFQSKPGPMLAANYVASNAEVAPSLGRPLSGGAANVTVNLIPPGARYGDRINQLDVRVARTFRIGRTRTRVAVDVYNALNASPVLAYNSSFVPQGSWLQPTAILSPRFVKIAAELDF
jgi:Carboxypeptidase regulatory-like domain